MKRYVLIAAATAALGLASSGAWADTLVNSFALTNAVPGVWGVSDTRTGTTGSTASIVSSAPAGDPVGPGAAVITTDSNTGALGEVGVSNNYGTAASVIGSNNISLAYSYYKAASTGNAETAPAIKLTFSNPTDVGTGDNRGFVTLIYEPYWNITPGVSNPVPTDVWRTDNIGSTTGVLWATKGFGQPGGGGGPPLLTLSGWLTSLDTSSGGQFSNATLIGVEVGIGSNTPNQTGYFDDVSINGTAIANTTYNFEPAAAVPLPKSAWGGLALIGGLGLVAGSKRLRRQEA